MMSEQEKQYIVKQRALGKSFVQIGRCGREFTAFGNPHKRFCSRKCFADSRKAAQVMEVRE